MNKLILPLLLCASMGLTACQMMIPNAKGLPEVANFAQESQQQVDIFWQQQSFSFLLYQQQKNQSVHVIAMSLTGQVLFELDYQQQKITVLQRDKALKALPLDFLMRDIWWATMPASQVQNAVKSVNWQSEIRSDQRIFKNHDNVKKLIVTTTAEQKRINIENLTVPYRMVLTQTASDFLQ